MNCQNIFQGRKKDVRFWASATVQLRPSLFSDFMQHRLAAGYKLLGQPVCSILTLEGGTNILS